MGPDLEFLVGLVPSPLNGSGRMQDLRRVVKLLLQQDEMGLSAGYLGLHPRSGDGSPAPFTVWAHSLTC